MRLDGLTLNELAKEIDLRCKGLRVEKVTSAGRHAVVISLQRGNDLLVSSSPNGARAVLTSMKSGTRAESVGFVMVLRKYIEGGRFLKALKRRQENAIELWFQGWDDDEGIKPKLLLLEAVGPKSNIFFLDESNLIIGSLKGTDDRRAGSPGQSFEPLPPFEMPDALSCTKETSLTKTGHRHKTPDRKDHPRPGPPSNSAAIIITMTMVVNWYSPHRQRDTHHHQDQPQHERR